MKYSQVSNMYAILRNPSFHASQAPISYFTSCLHKNYRFPSSQKGYQVSGFEFRVAASKSAERLQHTHHITSSNIPQFSILHPPQPHLTHHHLPSYTAHSSIVHTTGTSRAHVAHRHAGSGAERLRVEGSGGRGEGPGFRRAATERTTQEFIGQPGGADPYGSQHRKAVQ
jgi:hypothetical protein